MNIEVTNMKEERLDLFLTKKIPELSRSRIQSLIKSGDIKLNDTTTKPKASVVSGDVITVLIPEAAPEETLPENIPVDVLFEDEHIIIINKAPGMVVHPAAGNATGTLVNALLHHCEGKLADQAGEDRPGIVHRLDKDTSGCMVVAKSNTAYQHLVEQFANRTTEKEYLTVTQGKPHKDSDTIKTNIGRHPVNRMKMAVVAEDSGKVAITDYQILHYDEASDSSLVHCIIHTGRTHQIRVHMHHISCPIIGDVIYSKTNRQKPQPGRLMLHARRLCITHPITESRLEFRAPIPEEYNQWTHGIDAPILKN